MILDFVLSPAGFFILLIVFCLGGYCGAALAER